MLLLAGLWVGVQDRVTTYDDHLGADLVVVPAGTRNLFADPFERIDLSPDEVSNADMGDLFENLIYRFAESANDGAGQFYTPRDVVRLLVDLVYADDTEALRDRGTVRSIYDPTVGTGGMLTVADEHLHDLNPDASTALFGQEINPRTYAICKADLLIKGQDPSNVRQGDTLHPT